MINDFTCFYECRLITLQITTRSSSLTLPRWEWKLDFQVSLWKTLWDGSIIEYYKRWHRIWQMSTTNCDFRSPPLTWTTRDDRWMHEWFRYRSIYRVVTRNSGRVYADGVWPEKGSSLLYRHKTVYQIKVPPLAESKHSLKISSHLRYSAELDLRGKIDASELLVENSSFLTDGGLFLQLILRPII